MDILWAHTGAIGCIGLIVPKEGLYYWVVHVGVALPVYTCAS